MRNQKGLTLVEVMGSIVLLGIAVLVITYVLQQSTIDTKSNEKTDQSVVITRNLMEEIKSKLKSNQAETTVQGQAVSLANLRNLSSVVTIYYPSDTDRRYELKAQAYGASLGTIPVATAAPYNLDEVFRRITVTCKDLTTSKQFELEAYVEYK